MEWRGGGDGGGEVTGGGGGGSRVAFDNIRPLCDQRLLLNRCPGHAVVEEKGPGRHPGGEKADTTSGLHRGRSEEVVMELGRLPAGAKP